MNFILFASTVLFGFVIAFAISKDKKTQAAMEKKYWEKEAAANNTRRKPLDDLDYIKLPMEIFPMVMEQRELCERLMMEDFTQEEKDLLISLLIRVTKNIRRQLPNA